MDPTIYSKIEEKKGFKNQKIRKSKKSKKYLMTLMKSKMMIRRKRLPMKVQKGR
jgi:hypothetical protein